MKFWELITTDGEVKYIQPQFAEAINRDISSGKEHIGNDEKIRVKDIKRFRESDRPYYGEEKQLNPGELTEAQTAFNTPVIIDDCVKALAAKKRVPTRKIEYYQKIGYRILKEEENGAWVGFWVPAHLFDGRRYERATREEAQLIP
jgi:hypothetical protein